MLCRLRVPRALQRARAARRDRRTCFSCFPGRLERADVDCMRALLALLGVELDLDAFAQRAIAIGLDCAVVNEEIFALVIGSDEPKAFLIAEPLDCSGCHVFTSTAWVLRNAEGAA